MKRGKAARRPGRPGRPGRAPAPGQATRAARRLRRLVLVALALLGISIAVGWFWWKRPRPAPAPLPTPPPMAGSVEDVYRHGRELVRDGRWGEALVFLRYAVEQRPDQWNTHFSYAIAIMNTVYDSRVHRGVGEPVTRSSFERVQTAKEALEHLDRAEALTHLPHDLAMCRRIRAQLLGASGFPWDSFLGYRKATEADPSWQEAAVLGDNMLMALQNPTLSDAERYKALRIRPLPDRYRAPGKPPSP